MCKDCKDDDVYVFWTVCSPAEPRVQPGQTACSAGEQTGLADNGRLDKEIGQRPVWLSALPANRPADVRFSPPIQVISWKLQKNEEGSYAAMANRISGMNMVQKNMWVSLYAEVQIQKVRVGLCGRRLRDFLPRSEVE